MSLYAKENVLKFIRTNKNLLLRLDKFRHLNSFSSDDEFLNSMKIKINDVSTLYSDLVSQKKILFFNINELKLINSNSSFPFDKKIPMTIEEIKEELDIVKNDLINKVDTPSTKKVSKFFDLYDTLNINGRAGSMSFSLCTENNTINELYDKMCKNCNNTLCTCSPLQKNDKSASVSLNPIYYNINNKLSFGRISYYRNKLPVCIYDFSGDNYKNRFIFRKIVTKLILGEDFFTKIIVDNLNPIEGFFKDNTIGQEIYYYFLEIYNYDRYNFLLKSYNSFISNFNRGLFEEFLNSPEINREYPPFDGVLYFDHSIHNNIQYPGTECLLFIKEIITKIFGIKCAFNNKFYNSLQFVDAINDFNMYLDNPNDLVPIKDVCKEFNNIYKNKYLKYKKKYLTLANKLG
jgi:hypothetical protein